MNKILIIEDDQLVAKIYRDKLIATGFKVEIALNGEAGLEKVQGFRPDLLILDLMLPKMTGIEVLQKVRALADFQHLPVVVFSNTYLTNVVQEAWKAGATKCLSKANCSPKQIIDVVQGIFTKPSKASDTSELHRTDGQGTGPNKGVGEPDVAFQAEMRKSFVESLPASLASLRSQHHLLSKSTLESVRLKQLHELYCKVHALTGNAAIAGTQKIARMADAFEALLKELQDKPRNINASTLRTVAHAIDFLGVVFDHTARTETEEPHQPVQANILVVDDEAISRRAVTYALEKAKLQSVNVDDPQAALNLLSEKHFDLVFLDVNMPGMTGFELCTKLRSFPAHRNTPVIFVTGLSDFDSRANSTMSGGNDLIAKPFLFIELAVKALVHILRGELKPPAQNPLEPHPAHGG